MSLDNKTRTNSLSVYDLFVMYYSKDIPDNSYKETNTNNFNSTYDNNDYILPILYDDVINLNHEKLCKIILYVYQKIYQILLDTSIMIDNIESVIYRLNLFFKSKGISLQQFPKEYTPEDLDIMYNTLYNDYFKKIIELKQNLNKDKHDYFEIDNKISDLTFDAITKFLSMIYVSNYETYNFENEFLNIENMLFELFNLNKPNN